MKSRLLSIAAVFSLLLALLTSSAVAQLTSTAEVDFLIKKATEPNWRTASAGEDTVGRETNWRVSFSAGSQTMDVSKYIVVFPVGTAIDSAELETGGVRLISQVTADITDILDPAHIEILVKNLPDATYSSSAQPKIRLIAPRNVSQSAVYKIDFIKGVYNGAVLTSSNSHGRGATDEQQNMFISLVVVDSPTDTIVDTLSFYLKNDKAAGVKYNTAVTAIISGNDFSGSDTIGVVDRFGNFVPDFLTAAGDSVVMSVASKSIGVFNLNTTTKTNYANTAVLKTDSTSITFVNNATDASVYEAATGLTFQAAAGSGTPTFFQQIDVTDGTQFKSYENNDLIFVPIFLGNAAPPGHTDGLPPKTAGVKLTTGSGVAAGDTVTITFVIKAPSARKASSTSYLGVGNGSLTTTVKRVLQQDAATKYIGSLTMTAGASSYKVGDAVSLTITLKNIFGDNMTGNIGSSTVDSIGIRFEYYNGSTKNSTTTPLLQAGKQANSAKRTPPARFITNGTATFDSVTASPYGSWLYGGALASSAITATPYYLGMSSHPGTDSIAVIAYGKSNGVVDTVKLKIEPGYPVYFDTDTLAANLSTAQVVDGSMINKFLPLFAMDTAYNRVSNFNLASTATAFLDGITLPSSGAVIKALNFLIDGRDPAGYASTTRTDSIRFEWVGARSLLSAIPKQDSSFIANLERARKDSSVVNLGSAGRDSLGLRLYYKGTNYRLTVQWDPATTAIFSSAPTLRTQDIALFTFQASSLVDSLESVAVKTVTRAGSTGAMYVKFAIPLGRSIGQNAKDSLVYVRFENMGTGGIPAGIAASKVAISLDSVSWYNALGVSQGASGAGEDSMWIATPVVLDASSASRPAWLRIQDFVFPTIADSSNLYRVVMRSDTSKVEAGSYFTVVADSLKMIKLLPPSAVLAIGTSTVPKWLSRITVTANKDTLRVGDPYKFQVVFADIYGNILNTSQAHALTHGNTRGIVIKSVDSTATGGDLVAQQVFNGATASGSGANMYDTLAVRADTIKTASASKNNAILADSVMVRLASTNLGTSYRLVVTDTASGGKDSVLIYTKNTVAKTLTISPDTLVRSTRGATLPTITATLKDTLGNALPDSAVTFALVRGDSAGTFVDTNSVKIYKDTVLHTLKDSLILVAPKTRKPSGTATATFKAGQGDSLSIKVSFGSLTAKYFVVKTTVAAAAMAISFKTPPDSLYPDTSHAASIVIDITDANGVKKAYFVTHESMLTLGTTTHKFTESTPVLTWSDTLTKTSPYPDSTRWTVSIKKKALGTKIQYKVQGIDNSSTKNDTTTSAVQRGYIVAPKRGKRELSTAPVNVADVMRTVYLVADKVPAASVSTVDWLGLDLDQSGDFDTPDIDRVLGIWRGTSTLLAGATQVEKDRSAKTSLSYAVSDKANAILSINLESSGNLNMAVFRVKYDTEKFVLGEAVATGRLTDLTVVTNNNQTEGVYSVVVINVNGRAIAGGTGAIVTIPVSAVGEKFDGVGEISLLNAGFEEGVKAELNRDVLSPKAMLPKAFALSQNYPNPFNPSTTVAYDIPEGKEAFVRMNVYNMRGQLIRTLVDELKSEGSYQVQWDGLDNSGRRVSSGVYFYRIVAGEFSQTRKMVILK